MIKKSYENQKTENGNYLTSKRIRAAALLAPAALLLTSCAVNANKGPQGPDTTASAAANPDATTTTSPETNQPESSAVELSPEEAERLSDSYKDEVKELVQLYSKIGYPDAPESTTGKLQYNVVNGASFGFFEASLWSNPATNRSELVFSAQQDEDYTGLITKTASFEVPDGAGQDSIDSQKVTDLLDHPETQLTAAGSNLNGSSNEFAVTLLDNTADGVKVTAHYLKLNTDDPSMPALLSNLDRATPITSPSEIHETLDSTHPKTVFKDARHLVRS